MIIHKWAELIMNIIRFPGLIEARHRVLAGFRWASDCVGVQSDPHLCFKHPGKLV